MWCSIFQPLFDFFSGHKNKWNLPLLKYDKILLKNLIIDVDWKILLNFVLGLTNFEVA